MKSPGFISRLQESLTGKLVVVLGVVIFLGSGVFWYVSVRTDEKNLMDNALAFITSYSEVVKRSIRHDMMLFRRDDIQHIVASIGTSEAVTGVRVFDSAGKIAYSSEGDEKGRRVQKDSPACIGCHANPANPSETLKSGRRWSIFEESDGHRVLRFVEPIYNEPDCFTAACHAHNSEQRVLGVLTTDFSLQGIDARVAEQKVGISLYLFIFLGASVALLYFVLWRLVLRPVSALSRGMRRVSSGDLSWKVPAMSRDEIGRLALTFNTMTDELAVARRRMEQWAQTLEEEVQKKSGEIKKAQDKLLQAEKLAALGRLTSEIAHEIRNPLTALGGFGRRLFKLASGDKEKEYAEIVVSEVDRLEHILRDVMTFSREAKFRLKREPVTEAVEESLAAFSAVLDDNSIKLELDFGAEMPVLMDREQVRQAVNNLISNAADAMPEGGVLRVSTRAEHLNNITYVVIHMFNTGEAIPAERLPLIFEPFYTSKVEGRGTGLGLSISRKIMEEHGGFIRAENVDGTGVRVSLYFPYQSEKDLLKIPCWDFMKCGRNGVNALKCPAFPNFGRVCWVVAGTFCEGKVQGAFAQKYEDCKKCEFYQEAVRKETETPGDL